MEFDDLSSLLMFEMCLFGLRLRGLWGGDLEIKKKKPVFACHALGLSALEKSWERVQKVPPLSTLYLLYF